MKEDFMDTWVNYAILMKLPFKDISKVRELLDQEYIHLIYDKVSIGKIQIKAIEPSGQQDESE
jgi:hypothetical protein